MNKKITNAQLQRYPIYLKLLRNLRDNGVEYISSRTLANELKCSEEQVRKDLQLISSEAGINKLGRNVKQTIIDIKNALDYNNPKKAVVIGVGHLGRALLNYRGFKKFGLEIVASFDVDERIIGTSTNGITIHSLDLLPDFLAKNNVSIGILVVPTFAAQHTANFMVESGIKAIWNFAPTFLNLPEDIVVENIDLAASLASLAYKINNK